MSVAGGPLVLPGPDHPAELRRPQAEALGVEANFHSNLALAGDIAIAPDVSILAKLTATLDVLRAASQPARMVQDYLIFDVAAASTGLAVGAQRQITLPAGIWTLDRIVVSFLAADFTVKYLTIQIDGLLPHPFRWAMSSEQQEVLEPKWRVPQQMQVRVLVGYTDGVGQGMVLLSFMEDRHAG